MAGAHAQDQTDEGLLNSATSSVGEGLGEVVRRLPPALPLDGADPELAARRRTRCTGRRRGVSAKQHHDDGASLQPVKRNRGGEQDLDHIIAAAARMDRATLEGPVKPGLIFCLDRAFPFELNRSSRRRRSPGDRGVIGIDIAGAESATFRVAYRNLFDAARQAASGRRSIPVNRGRSRRSPGSWSCSSTTASDTA
jgi:hypothetical protein